MRQILAAMAVIYATTTPCVAQSEARVEKISQAFKAWAAANDIKQGKITVFYADTIFASMDLTEQADGEQADDQITLASLSKAITGVCLAHMVDQGLLNWDTPISNFFGDKLQDLGIENEQTARLTIGQFVTHSSGLTPDSTQGRMPRWRNKSSDRHEKAAARGLERKTQGPTGAFAYNNENYAALGAIIEKAAQQPYDVYCNREVLEPVGISTAQMDARFGAYGAWGGWQMSSADFARFVIAYMGRNAPYGTAPDDAPSAELGRGIKYGLGSFYRTGPAGNNFWHFGALCFADGVQLGSYFAHWRGGWGVVATYEKCVDFPTMGALDQAVVGAALK